MSTIEQIKRNPATRRLPVIAVTAVADSTKQCRPCTVVEALATVKSWRPHLVIRDEYLGLPFVLLCCHNAPYMLWIASGEGNVIGVLMPAPEILLQIRD